MGEGERKKILIACEDGSFREDICSALEKRGYVVYNAGDGSSALEITLFRLPDLLILCFALGVISSEKLAQILKANPKTKHIPIIGLYSINEGVPPFSKEVAAFVRKPVNMTQLISTVTRILGDEHEEMKEGETALLDFPREEIPPQTAHVSDESESGPDILDTFPEEFFEPIAERSADHLDFSEKQNDVALLDEIDEDPIEDFEIEHLFLDEPVTAEEEEQLIVSATLEPELLWREEEGETSEDLPESAIHLDGGEKVLLKAFWDISGSIRTTPVGAEALDIEEESLTHGTYLPLLEEHISEEPDADVEDMPAEGIGEIDRTIGQIIDSEKADNTNLSISLESAGAHDTAVETSEEGEHLEDPPELPSPNELESLKEEPTEDRYSGEFIEERRETTESVEPISKTTPAAEGGEAEEVKETPYVLPPKIPPSKILDLEMEREMIGLYQSIESLLPSGESKIIQFIGSREGEGTSTIVREFARIVEMKAGKTVLLMDADYQKPSQHLFFDIEPVFSLEEIIRNGKPLHRALSQVSNTHLYVNLISRKADTILRIFNSPRINTLFEILKKRFDLILIDSPPATVSPESLILSSKADGVLLVLEAENTRWMVAENVKNRILKNGGNLLGIVFNKKRHHIPEFIYKRL